MEVEVSWMPLGRVLNLFCNEAHVHRQNWIKFPLGKNHRDFSFADRPIQVALCNFQAPSRTHTFMGDSPSDLGPRSSHT